jgi:hypothetical protein
MVVVTGGRWGACAYACRQAWASRNCTARALGRRALGVVPIARWFPHYFRYGWATNIKFDLLAAITIAFMLIPQARTLPT